MSISSEKLRKVLHPIQIDTMHFRFKPRRNPGSQSQHRSVNRTAVAFDEVSLLITHLSLKVKFNITTGLSFDEKILHPDIYLGSQSLEYIFDYDWGWSSLMVNGRMEFRNNALKLLFARVFQLVNLKNRGISITKQPWQALGQFSQTRIGDIEPLDIFLEAKRRSKVSHHSSL